MNPLYKALYSLLANQFVLSSPCFVKSRGWESDQAVLDWIEGNQLVQIGPNWFFLKLRLVEWWPRSVTWINSWQSVLIKLVYRERNRGWCRERVRDRGVLALKGKVILFPHDFAGPDNFSVPGSGPTLLLLSSWTPFPGPNVAVYSCHFGLSLTVIA